MTISKNRILGILFRLWLGLLVTASAATAQGINECPDELFPKYDKKSRLYGYTTWLGEWKIPPTYLRASPFDGKYARVQLDKKFGVINCEGFMVIAANYDEIGPLTYGKAFARIGDNYTYFDASGKTGTNEIFQDVQEITDHNMISWVKIKGKWAQFDKETARLRTQPLFDAVSTMSDSASIVRQGTRFGIYNNAYAFLMADSFEAVTPIGYNFYALLKKGKNGVAHALGRVLLKPQFDSVKAHNGYIYAWQNAKVTLYNFRGRKLTNAQDYISEFSEKFAVARKDTAWAFIKEDGFPATPYHFSHLTTPLNGYAVAKMGNFYGFYQPKQLEFAFSPSFQQLIRLGKGPYYLGKRKGTWSFMDPKKPNDALESQQFDSVAISDSLQNIRVWIGKKIHYFNVYEAKLLNAQGFAVAEPMRGKAAFVKRDSVWGVWSLGLQTDGINYGYDTLQWLVFDKQLLIITGKLDKKEKMQLGLYTVGGQAILKNQYQEISPVTLKQFKVKRKDKWGVVYAGDIAGIDMKYDYLSNRADQALVSDMPEWPAVARTKNKVQLINEQGQGIGDSYDKLTYLGEGLYLTESSGKRTIINSKGLLQKYAEAFDTVCHYDQKLAPFSLKGKWGFMTIQGRHQVPAIYEEVYPYVGRSALVKKVGKWGAIDRSNNWIMQPVYDRVEVVNGRRRLATAQ